MKYPKLVPESVCRSPCRVILKAEGISEDGERLPAFSADLKCLFQSSSRRILNAKREEITISAEAYFSHDFCPELPEIPDGEIYIFNTKRHIIRGQKARNPDGSVNYIRLDVI